MVYVLSPLLGLVLGIISVFFAQGGIHRRSVFARAMHFGGAWRRQRVLTLCASVAIGLYSAWLYGTWCRELVGLQLLCSYLLAASVTDLRGRRIPDDMSLFFAALFALWQVSSFSLTQLLSTVLGGVTGGLLLLVCHLARREAIGLGDVKLLAVCGLITGFPGVLYVFVRAMVAIFIYSVVQLLRRRLNRGAQVPLAPFMLFGALI